MKSFSRSDTVQSWSTFPQHTQNKKSIKYKNILFSVDEINFMIILNMEVNALFFDPGGVDGNQEW
jgi:hypothetical protein